MDTQEIYHGQTLAMRHIHTALNLYHELPITKRDILVKWKKIIKEIPAPLQEFHYDQLKSLTIGFPTGMFSYLFDLNTIQHYIKEETIQPITLKTKFLTSHITEEAILRSSMEEPIILLDTPLLQRSYCLSGHATLFLHQQKGKANVSVFAFPEMEMLSLMHDELSKKMYMFHRDLQTLIATPLFPPKHQLFYFNQ